MVSKNKNKFRKGKKGQSFSADLIVVIIIVLFGVVFLVVNKINDVNYGSGLKEVSEKVTSESNVIFNALKSDGVIDDNNNLDIEKLKKYNYEELKENLGITSDFAIVLEKDGKLVKIDSEKDIYCLGTDKIVVNGKTCLN